MVSDMVRLYLGAKSMTKFHSWEYCPCFYLLVIFWGLLLLIHVWFICYHGMFHIAFDCFIDWVYAARWNWEFLLEGSLSWSEVLGFWLLFFFSRGIDIKGAMNLLFMEMQMLKRRLKERQWENGIDLQWWVCWLTVFRPFCLLPLCSSLLSLALHVASVVIFSPTACNMLRFASLPFAKSHFAYVVSWPW